MKLSLETEGDGIDIIISHIQKDRDSGLFREVKDLIKNHRDDPIRAFRLASDLIAKDRLKERGITNG